MTAVARFTVKGHPVLVGDLLISGKATDSKGREDDLPTIPTRKDLPTFFPPGSSRVPYRMEQKLAVLADNLVLGYTGKAEDAFRVFNEIIHGGKNRPWTEQSLNHYLESKSASGTWRELSVLGYLADAAGQIHEIQIGDAVTDRTIEPYGCVTVGGSGHKDIVRLLHSAHFPRASEGQAGPSEIEAVAHGFNLAGSFMSFENLDGGGLRLHYGAGYEIAAMRGGKFSKVDNVTYVFWKADYNDGNPRIRLNEPRMFRFAYDREGVLVIRESSYPLPEMPMGVDRLFFVRPAYRDFTPKERSWTDREAEARPSFDAWLVCHHITIPLPNGSVGVHTLISTRGDSRVRIEEGPEIIINWWKPSFLEEVQEHMRAEVSRKLGLS